MENIFMFVAGLVQLAFYTLGCVAFLKYILREKY